MKHWKGYGKRCVTHEGDSVTEYPQRVTCRDCRNTRAWERAHSEYLREWERLRRHRAEMNAMKARALDRKVVEHVGSR